MCQLNILSCDGHSILVRLLAGDGKELYTGE